MKKTFLKWGLVSAALLFMVTAQRPVQAAENFALQNHWYQKCGIQADGDKVKIDNGVWLTFEIKGAELKDVTWKVLLDEKDVTNEVPFETRNVFQSDYQLETSTVTNKEENNHFMSIYIPYTYKGNLSISITNKVTKEVSTWKAEAVDSLSCHLATASYFQEADTEHEDTYEKTTPIPAQWNGDKRAYVLEAPAKTSAGKAVIGWRVLDGDSTFYRSGEEVVVPISYSSLSRYILFPVFNEKSWFKKNEQWFYQENLVLQKNKWILDNGKWYYLSPSGSMYFNKWLSYNEAWYYVTDSGVMLTNSWAQENNAWYYLDAGGKMLKDLWIYYGNAWYYLGSNGVMQKDGWLQYNGDWYMLDSEGKMLVNSWYFYNQSWYYLGSNGVMQVSNWVYDNGKWYAFDADGKMLANQWYLSNHKWYYLTASGAMATNQRTPDGYRVNENGEWIR